MKGKITPKTRQDVIIVQENMNLDCRFLSHQLQTGLSFYKAQQCFVKAVLAPSPHCEKRFSL